MPAPSYRDTFLSALLGVAILTVGIGRTSAEEGAPATDPTVREPSAAQMKAMHRRAASLAVRRGKENAQPVGLVDAALLRYSSPGGDTGTTDGSIWAWGKGGRPAALAAVFFHRLEGGDEKWSCELLSLSDEPVSVHAAGWKWTPARSELRWQTVPDAPAVAESDAQRTRQMKDLARRFSASATYHKDRTDQLRLMIRAIHRYADPDNGLIDGAVYAFASGTNPEALLLLEARASGGERPAWHFSFARMGAGAVEARLDDKVVWECPAIKAWDSREPYFSVFGSDADVFGATGDRGE
jgi:hypothetical protein